MTAPHTGEAPAALVFERVPAASGSLLRAWLSVVRSSLRRTPDNRAIAAWAGATTKLWIMCSLIAACAFDMLAGLGDAASGRKYGPLDFPSLTSHSVLLVFLGPVYHLVEVFGLATIAAFIASLTGYGPMGHRFVRILRPWSLVQVPISVAGMIGYVIGAPLERYASTNPLAFLGRGVWGTSSLYAAYLGLVALTVGVERFRAQTLLKTIVILSWLGILFGFVWTAGWLESLLKLHA